MSKVVLITSGQPSLNPRLVKEADALQAAGYEVLVIYAYWNTWGTRYDRDLLGCRKWKAIRAGGDPIHRPVIYFLSRMAFRFMRRLHLLFRASARWTDWSMARSSWFLYREARKHPADLFIAHNLGALPAAARAAGYFNSRVGFDAEDFHRQEAGNDPLSEGYRRARQIEDRYLPGLDQLTASSPMIAERYRQLYALPVTTILNVFPRWDCPVIQENTEQPLRLFWFSQTIGAARGLETVIEAVGLSGTACQLHLLGEPSPGYHEQLQSLWAEKGLLPPDLCFYEPVAPEHLFHIAANFDIGLAAEVPVCLNRELALTNKLFTYMQCGLAIAASDTPAQRGLIDRFPDAGRVYSNAGELAGILRAYDRDRRLLTATRRASRLAADKQMNWENESLTFLALVSRLIACR
jgi:glycosyltransferase involved in cell wall biosynthesis